MSERNWTLLDTVGNISHADFSLTANDLGIANHDFHVEQKRLAGGLKEGVDAITVDNGRFRFVVLPTRGMGIWKGWLGKPSQPGSVEVAWGSPLDGPVHPRFVPLSETSGLGWLDGFDELFVRCGLKNNGAPDFDDHGRLKYPLHGQIANRPARHVELAYDDEREEIRLTGLVDETRFLFHRLEMRLDHHHPAGRARLARPRRSDEFGRHADDDPIALSHQFRSTTVGAGLAGGCSGRSFGSARPRAAEGIETWDRYAAPTPGYSEQVYFAELVAGPDNLTHVLLENAGRTLGVSVGFDKRQLPCFTLWKNTAALADGYVTGLEPATNYPNPRSFEEKQKRVIELAPGATLRFDTSLTVHPDEASVAAAEKAIAQIAGGRKPQIAPTPRAGWSVGATSAWS